ncbi:uncharacterized protein LOC132724396 [Ruditapes philippinarum]|uniref:uncharacterized protein LOC132724396 n=1 Tax=Ruditapes philippinarum TaxID=129788 RepID=UPI00295BF958|nr:uncharacterized protein LOC132724396 [Ruditapes philippinarum]
MSAGWKFVKKLRSLKGGVQLLSAAAVTATVTNADKSRRKKIGKDEIFFLSKEDNAVPTKAKIIMQEIEENRDPVLKNGDVNWACACIEKDVIGPCNEEFRKVRQFIHVNDFNDDIDNLDAVLRGNFDNLLEDYIVCTMDHPVYYADTMLDEEKEQIRKNKEKEKEEEERRKKEREANHRKFGKDEVVFLTKEENSIPSKVMIPKVEVEENRLPVLPNGEINWGCTCIEKDVVGPCNLEFREFRSFVAKHRNVKDDSDIPMIGREIITNFIACVRANPVFYSFLSKNDDDNDKIDGNDNDENSPTKSDM